MRWIRYCLFLVNAAALSTAPHAAFADSGWRNITPEEEQFVQLVEKRVYANLRNAAQKMGAKWKIDNLKTNEFQRTAVDDVVHKNRPHEVRIEFHMEFIPADDEELGKLDGEIDTFAQKVGRMEQVPAALMRSNPAFKRELSAQVIVNYVGFMPMSLKAASALGEVINVPGTVFSYLRWKDVGAEAPKRILYLGEFRRGPYKGEERLLEAFAKTPDCRDVRTVIVEVSANETVSDQFIKALDLKDLNALVANH